MKNSTNFSKRIPVLFMLVFLVGGCSSKQPFDYASAQRNTVTVPSDAYYLSNQSLVTLEKDEYEEADVVYDVEDEMDLAKVIQYTLGEGKDVVSYQSANEMDLDKTAEILSLLNPFDLSIAQNDITYTNAKKEILYISHQVTITNLDERYSEALKEARQRLQTLLREDMSTEEKIKVIHDDLIKNSIYAVEHESSQNRDSSFFSAAGVLVDGKGVCTGYSRAFMIMASLAGIPAIYVGSKEMNHGWNYVYDGALWRYIDVTWDDPVPDLGDRIQTTYFLKTRGEFFQDGAHKLSIEEENQVKEIAAFFF